MAGVNAARRVKNLEPLILRRDQAYIGVLIDDLVTKGTLERYRMYPFAPSTVCYSGRTTPTSVSPRSDTKLASSPRTKPASSAKSRERIDAEILRLETTSCNSETSAQLLRQQELKYRDLPSPNPGLTDEDAQQVEIAIKYAGYISRQESEIARFKGLEDKRIPPAFDYTSVPSLRNEARQKFIKIRPATLGQASRISGVGPADISILELLAQRRDEAGP